jgi:hypothetical protein
MTININLQMIHKATNETLVIEGTGRRFDVVRVHDTAGNQLNLFFEDGRGDAVADAISRALTND